MKETISERRKKMFLILEEDLAKGIPRQPDQYVLGTDIPTFLDLYLAMVAHYAPHPRFVLVPCPWAFAYFQGQL